MFRDKSIHKKTIIALVSLIAVILTLLFFIANFPIQTAYVLGIAFACFILGMIYIAFYIAFDQCK